MTFAFTIYLMYLPQAPLCIPVFDLIMPIYSIFIDDDDQPSGHKEALGHLREN